VAGFDPAVFWDLTPRLYLIHMRGAAERQNAATRRLRVLAWNTATLTRAKKLPSAKQFIAGDDHKVRGADALAMLRAHAGHLPKRSWEEWQRHWSAH
jgi:hypothetical protein